MNLIDAIHAAAAEGASRTLSPAEVQELSGILRAAKAFLETRDALNGRNGEKGPEKERHWFCPGIWRI